MTKILVVDDEPLLQEMLKDILSLADYDVMSAGNGEEGLKQIYAWNPDLIILDCSMPVLDGFETLERMRADPMLVGKPVIMLSVLSSEFDQIKGLKLGVDDYITKPFKATVLLARVKAILSRTTSSVSANPLTQLSGNAVIKTEAEKRIAQQLPFAMLYLDLGNFKAFNDKYGFQRGDEIIKHTANILISAVRATAHKGDFIGHIGGDDFIVITVPDKAVPLAEQVIHDFDASIGSFYTPEDREQKHIVAEDRDGQIKTFPLMSISVAIISTQYTKIAHYAMLGELAAELKKLAKKKEMSSYVIDGVPA